MKPWTPEPGIVSGEGRELALSGLALAELMRAVLEKGVPFRFRAMGWSMVPLIHDGDVITVAPLLDDLPHMGDVVAFVRPETGKVVVHRIVARWGDAWLIKGDNSNGEWDGLFSRGDLLGMVTAVERGGRMIRLGLGPERGLVALLSRSGLLLPLRQLLYPLLLLLPRRGAK